MKLNEIINCQPTLQKLTKLELPIGTAIALLQLCKDTAVHVQAFQTKQRALFEKYGTLDVEQDQLVVAEENTETFKKEIQEVLDTDVDLAFKMVKVADFGTEAKLTVSDVNNISWMIE